MGNLLGPVGERRTWRSRVHPIPCLDDHWSMDHRQLRLFPLPSVGRPLTDLDDFDEPVEMPNIVDVGGDQPGAMRMSRCGNHQI